ncbi:PilW family protein [Sansalvadorimonas sp. 2012CJ34-2]|uniref:PilW family protein n=1 Tax=Parendozoicomonas callyspongiae TaxID=2942213 RepID=A0ABT0PDS9_9GAMM|nr:PilW family protein [Sansalvadorimonas sp. 2012CJ34-2]MCL6269485.1 PilW family protein [Sansalvadorimonas sp. 2012CJ34-2]
MLRLQRGSLLIEMMISSLIGTLLLYGALSVLLNSRSSFLTRDSLSRIEERGRLALEILSEDIRMSGYKGCVSSDAQSMVQAVNLSGSWMQPQLGIRGWSYAGTDFKASLGIYSISEGGFDTTSWEPHAAADKGTGVDILRGNDVLELWVAEPYVMEITSATQTQLNVDPSTMTGFPEAGDTDQERLLVVSDCARNILVKADSFKSSGTVILDPANTNDQSLQLTSMSQSQAVMLQGRMYYLDIPSTRDRPSLYRKDINADGSFKNAVEVLPGVLNLQFLYGESTNSELSANRYVEASEVSDWSKVISIRIFLLVETEADNAVPVGSDFHYFGNNYSPENTEDKHVRRQYTTTVALRNRALGLTITGAPGP